jgi:hypothetical protein
MKLHNNNKNHINKVIKSRRIKLNKNIKWNKIPKDKIEKKAKLRKE